MGNQQTKKFKTTNNKIPLPSTVKDIDPNNYYKLATNNKTGLIDNKLLSIASLLYKNNITNYDPFKIVSLQSLIDSGLCVARPTWLGGNIFVFRLIFSDDLQYLPVGDVVVNATTNINSRNIFNINPFPLLFDGMNSTNSVFQLDCNSPPFVDLSTAVINSSSVYQDNNMWDKTNVVAYNKPISPAYISKPENNPWWSLTLPDDIQIFQIDVFNRDDIYFENLNNSIITIKNKNKDIVYTENFGKRISLLYVFTPSTSTTPYVTGNQIIISRQGTNLNLVIGKIIINKNFKHLGWYSDNEDRTLSPINTPVSGYLDTINKFKTQKIVSEQGNLVFLGESCLNNVTKSGSWIVGNDKLNNYVPMKYNNGYLQCMATDGVNCLWKPTKTDAINLISNPPSNLNNLSCNSDYTDPTHWCNLKSNTKLDYNSLDFTVNDLNRNGNMKFDDIPVLLVKNDSNYSTIIPNTEWKASAISWNWGPLLGNWGCLEIRDNKYNGCINFGTVFCVGTSVTAWAIDRNPVIPQSSLPGDYYAQLMSTRVYCAIQPNYVVCLSELYPTEVNYNYNSTDWINNRSVGGNIRPNTDSRNTIFTYTSPFGTFSALNDDNNLQLGGGPWKQNYKYYDIRPDILNIFCCSSFNTDSKNILKSNDLINHWDLATYCKNCSYGSSLCNDVINTKCSDANYVNTTYKDAVSQLQYSPCKQIFLKNQGNWDTLATNYANNYPNDNLSSCIKPKIPIDNSVPDIIKNYLLNNPQCVDINCGTNGYKLQNMVNKSCELNYVNCITTIDSTLGTGTNNKITMNNNPNCSINSTDTTPVNCVYSDWGSCINGTQTRTIVRPASNGGTGCDNTKLTQACGTTSTNVNCEVSDWSNCNSGIQTRTIIKQPTGNGTSCPTDLTRSCVQPEVFHISGYNYTKPQALDQCKLYNADLATETQLTDAFNKGADWCSTGWLKDTDTPAYPIQSQRAGCGDKGINKYLPLDGKAGSNCYGIRPTNVPAILPFNDIRPSQNVNCAVSDWSNCNNGIQTRTITTQPQGNGLSCPALSKTCSVDVNCGVSDWSSCNNGTQTRTITTQPSGNGLSCPVLSKSCGSNVNCVVSDWSSCNNGTQKRTITTQSSGSGTSCPTDLTRSCISFDSLTKTQKIIIYVVSGILLFILVIAIIVGLVRKS